MPSTKVDVELRVDHGENVGDDALHAAVAEALAGLTLIRAHTEADSAIVDDVLTVWVKGV